MPNFSESLPRLSHTRAPIIGAVFGLLLVLSPIALGARGYLIFFSFGGLVIVVGGVIAVAFMSFTASEVKLALDAIVKMFKQTPVKSDDLTREMANIVKWSGVIKNQGLRNFEWCISRAGIEDPVVRYGLNMVLGEYSPEDVRSMVNTAADASYERDSRPADVLEAMTSHAPAFGMVGTLIGMVAMLGNLTDNASAIGPSLAVAFLSTLYGVLSARMVYMPAAARLREEVESQRFRHHFLAEGLAMLAGKKSSMYIEDRLNGFLRPEVHNYFHVFGTNTKPTPLASRLRVAK